MFIALPCAYVWRMRRAHLTLTNGHCTETREN